MYAFPFRSSIYDGSSSTAREGAWRMFTSRFPCPCYKHIHASEETERGQQQYVLLNGNEKRLPN